MIFFLVTFFLVTFFLVTFVLVNLHRRTDGQTDRQKATPKSPPCMGTGGLKYGNPERYEAVCTNIRHSES